jgi:hypothetical protein
MKTGVFKLSLCSIADVRTALGWICVHCCRRFGGTSCVHPQYRNTAHIHEAQRPNSRIYLKVSVVSPRLRYKTDSEDLLWNMISAYCENRTKHIPTSEANCADILMLRHVTRGTAAWKRKSKDQDAWRKPSSREMIQIFVLRKRFEPAVPMFRQSYIIMTITTRRGRRRRRRR